MTSMERNANSVSNSELQELLQHFFSVNEPVMIWGSVGVGKSTGADQAATVAFGDQYEDDEKFIYTIIGSLIQSYDLMGVPSVIDGRTTWNPPVGTLLPPMDETRGGMVFIDEIMNAEDENVRQALMGLVLDRKLGNYTLPENYRIVMASNRAEDGTFAHTMSKAMGTRACHVVLEPNADEWLEWAKKANIDPRTRAFIKMNKDLLNQPDPTAKGNSFPCPRVWTKAAKANDLPPHIRAKVLAGYLGETVGLKYHQFLEVFAELPDLRKIAKDPANADIPQKIDVVYLLVNALANAATVSTVDAYAAYMARMNEDHQALFFRELKRVNPELSGLPVVTDWNLKNAHLAV